MPTSGLVVTLAPGPEAATTVDAIKNAAPFTVGEEMDGRFPVVLQAPTPADVLELQHWLDHLPGVQKVDLAFVSFEDTVDVG